MVESIKRNNGVALKGVIQSSLHDEAEGLNTQLRRRLDLFANVVHIKAMEGIKTRHNKLLDFIIIREQTEGEYSRMEHELVPGIERGGFKLDNPKNFFHVKLSQSLVSSFNCWIFLILKKFNNIIFNLLEYIYLNFFVFWGALCEEICLSSPKLSNC